MGAIYRGRFAPSPTGPLHAGSLVAALASWLDARAHGGSWLVRIEDIDTPRCVPGADALILQQLAACGLLPDAPPLYQSQRGPLYQQALDDLIVRGWAYPCACTRQEVAQAYAAQGRPKQAQPPGGAESYTQVSERGGLALAASGQARPRHGERVYPGTCRHGLQGRQARAWRFLTRSPESGSIAHPDTRWHDRRLGGQQQNVEQAVGDFVLQRADGLWAYQLAVVVDDAAQGITDVVRGEDLLDNTARQILLQRALGLPTPRYLHVPLVLGENGEKLSKQNGAAPLAPGQPLASLRQAGELLGLQVAARSVADWLAQAVQQWVAMHTARERAPVKSTL
ncbi:MAG: tRNA glutamyl-Q(34) synthetase GluQRS [Polaromonas sp.]|nr:tRNA glutamyl-Q(34) synthetase GluQRS [Polaromonas sp.]